MFKLRLRTQIVLFGLLLIFLPNAAYVYFNSTQDYLLAGQRQSLAHTATTIATLLHERPELFHQPVTSVQPVKSLLTSELPELQTLIQLDGEFDDWNRQGISWRRYGNDYLAEQSVPYMTDSLVFEHTVARDEQSIYAAFSVTDDVVLFRPQNTLRIDRNDFLQISTVGIDGILQRYILAPFEAGWVNAYLLKDGSYAPDKLETKIQGHWKLLPGGYSVELRFPLEMAFTELVFSIADVDDVSTRRINYVIATVAPVSAQQFLPASNDTELLDKTLNSLMYADSRIWILDEQKRVLAVKGNLNADSSQPLQAKRAQWLESINNLLKPLYGWLLGPPQLLAEDTWQGLTNIDSPLTELALTGVNGVITRTSMDNPVSILVAAQPVFIHDNVKAIVLAEQSTITTQRIVREAFEYQLTVSLLCMMIGATILLLFAGKIAGRISALRNATESAIDTNGKIVDTITPSTKGDEIGDLSRAFHDVLSRLSQYNEYLENMSSRLSHELRTPVAIVNSSLDNLELDMENHAIYLPRARQGINRLSKILQNMSEARRLEEVIRSTELESFGLNGLLQSCVDGYRMTHATYQFELDVSVDNPLLCGSPDLFVQMLDKIIANAVEFSASGETIRVRAFSKTNFNCVSITNQGSLLPENMRHQLLNSMISVRPNSNQSSSHLGLGLFIANMIVKFHGGHLDIDNLPDHSGVIVLLSFPKR